MANNEPKDKPIEQIPEAPKVEKINDISLKVTPQ
jgi:hypothetical protein